MDDYQIQMLRLAAAGYACSQIIIHLGLDARGEENPDLVRSMAGLAYGCGGGQATCGAIVGDTFAKAMEILNTHGFDPFDAP